jgi:hypothetical protein
MDKYLKRKKIFLNKSDQQSDNLTEEGDPLPSSPTPPPPISAPPKTNSVKKIKAEGKHYETLCLLVLYFLRVCCTDYFLFLSAPSKKKPAQVRKSSRRSRSSMDLGAEEELLSNFVAFPVIKYFNEWIFAVDTPEVGLTEELIPDMPEMQLEEHVIEESYEIPHGNTFFSFQKKL